MQLKRNSLQVKPTADDLEDARSDFEAEQKRVDREYDEWAKDKLKWAAQTTPVFPSHEL